MLLLSPRASFTGLQGPQSSLPRLSSCCRKEFLPLSAWASPRPFAHPLWCYEWVCARLSLRLGRGSGVRMTLEGFWGAVWSLMAGRGVWGEADLGSNPDDPSSTPHGTHPTPIFPNSKSCLETRKKQTSCIQHICPPSGPGPVRHGGPRHDPCPPRTPRLGQNVSQRHPGWAVSLRVGAEVAALGTLSRRVAFDQGLGWTVLGQGEGAPGGGVTCTKVWGQERGRDWWGSTLQPRPGLHRGPAEQGRGAG